MTDRVKALTVVLKEDLRVDDVEPLMNAIAMLHGVLDVRPDISTVDDYVARARIASEARRRLFEALVDLEEGP